MPDTPASSQAVFLSYASQDADAVRRMAETLRAAGIEVWFDQNELVGGDAWDAKIRQQIAACALFVPVISAATQTRLEGYFRIEWKLAALRTHAMAEEKAFLLPVVIDDTRDAEAKVPAEFKTVQWTRIGSAFAGPAADKSADSLPAFCERVKTLLDGSKGSVAGASLDDARSAVAPDGRGRATLRRGASNTSATGAPSATNSPEVGRATEERGRRTRLHSCGTTARRAEDGQERERKMSDVSKAVLLFMKPLRRTGPDRS